MELGIFFLMLHAGLESNPNDLFKALKLSGIVAIVGTFLPFLLVYLLATAHGYSQMESLLMGVVSSITSIAVTARMFKDNKIMKSKVANVTMGAAIIQDIFGLVIFSVLLGVNENGSSGFNPDEILFLLCKIVGFFAVVLIIGQVFFKQIHRILYEGNKGFTFTIIIALAFGLFAEYIGVHIIMGAFLAGLFIREEVIEPRLFNKIEDRVFGVSYSFLGPIFFASLAFNLDFAAVQTAPLFVVMAIFASVVGTIIGGGMAAKSLGMSKLESLSVGLAMNNHGVVELVVATIGWERGIISAEVFSILVIMAFIPTIIAIIGLRPLAGKIKKQLQTSN